MIDEGPITVSDFQTIQFKRTLPERRMFEKILVAYDGSKGAQKAFEVAVEIAARSDAQLHMISVQEKLPRRTKLIGEIVDVQEIEHSYFERVAEEAKRLAARHSVHLECTIAPGHRVKTIMRVADEGGFDLLVVGFSGHSRFNEHLWGRASRDLMRSAPCDVLVVK
jgi:nucleotide-binding universal stress UspA family protein